MLFLYIFIHTFLAEVCDRDTRYLLSTANLRMLASEPYDER